MAPTKSVTDLPKKVAKKRVTKAKPVKPPLKTPTCITVKIPNLGTKPPKIARKVTSQRKIELANEVALEQLTKLSQCPKVSHPIAKVLPIKIEPAITPEVTIKPTPKRGRKPNPKTSQESCSVNTPLDKKTTKPCEDTTKPKLKRKRALKASESQETPIKNPAESNNFRLCASEPELSHVMDKPGPKSRKLSLSLAKKKIATPKTPQVNTTDIKNTVEKPISATKARNGPVRTRQQKVIPDFFSDGAANGEQEEIPKTPVKRVYKRKQTPKKQEAKGTKKVSEETAVKRTRGGPRTKFVSERLNGNKLKLTRSKGKGMNAKEIKMAASMLENALENEAAQVKTRSNSVNSTNSNLSWTRDISTASSLTSGTTTCVTVSSSDFVRFDKKLPFVQVEHTNLDRLKVIEDGIEKKILDDDSLSSDSESDSSDSSSDSDLDGTESKPELNLSTSSLTAKSPQSDGMLSKTELLSIEMENLTNSLQNFHTEMSKWMVYDDDDTVTFTNLLEAMSLEKDLIANCESFSSILGVVENAENPETCRTEVTDFETKGYERPGTSREDLDRPSDKSRDKFVVNHPVHNSLEKVSPVESIRSSETFTNDNYNYVSFDERVCDDEDALSLYAESITGIESSRLSSSVSNISLQEPYVPKPRFQEAYIPTPTKPWLERYTYRPTRIGSDIPKRTEDVPLKIIEKKMIEKQNADSSSISKETELNKKALDLLEDANRLSSLAEKSVKGVDAKPRMFSHYQPVNAVKSALYRGHCFFHLAFQCKNMNSCRFPHVDIDVNVAKCRLAALSEDSLIEEYLLTAKFNNLRRKYALLFMQECKRREGTRILMEIAIDLGLGVQEWEDSTLRLNALEITLLHLNTISFDACDDILIFEHNGTMMCDALLLCMAHSQNFAQFKRAFVKLANFMAQIKRPVDIEIVGNILERVCILPCEDSLARGMLTLMENTDASIFENAMTKSFEVQLSNIESDVHDVYLLAKKAALDAQPELSPVPRVGREGPRHPSPDTTNLDSLKKAQMAQPTTFKRTIDTEAIRHLFKSPSNPAPKRYTAPRVQQQWRRGFGYSMRPPIRGRPNNGMPSGRRVYRTTNLRNGTNS